MKYTKHNDASIPTFNYISCIPFYIQHISCTKKSLNITVYQELCMVPEKQRRENDTNQL